MALVRDECLLPCKDAPELGYAKESSSEQYVPDVFYKVKLQDNKKILNIHRMMWICPGLLWSCYTLECYLCVSYCGLEPKASITFLELIVTYSGADGIVWRSQKRSQTCLVWVCYTRSVHKDESHLDHCWNSVCYIYSVFLLWNFQVKEQITVGRKHPHIRGLQTTSSRNWLWIPPNAVRQRSPSKVLYLCKTVSSLSEASK